MTSTFDDEALKHSLKHHGKLTTSVVVPLSTKDDLSTQYTPGVAAVSLAISKNHEESFTRTWRGRLIAVVSDGTAVLGLGNIGPEGALPVMEGKCALLKKFGGLDAIPLVVNSTNSDDIVRFVELLAPSVGGINLEDISAPRCFEIEERLQNLGIPVMHDDQHGTAVVVLAGLTNACSVTGKKLEDCIIVIQGAGAAGTAVARLLRGEEGTRQLVKELRILDRSGGLIIGEGTETIGVFTGKRVTREETFTNADVLIGLSGANSVTIDDVKRMNKPIIFALANPNPEITPEDAKTGGAILVATGRSDYPNQVNNALGFPGIFKGALSVRATRITHEMKLAASRAIASSTKPTMTNILPSVLDQHVHDNVANAVAEAWKLRK